MPLKVSIAVASDPSVTLRYMWAIISLPTRVAVVTLDAVCVFKLFDGDMADDEAADPSVLSDDTDNSTSGESSIGWRGRGRARSLAGCTRPCVSCSSTRVDAAPLKKKRAALVWPWYLPGRRWLGGSLRLLWPALRSSAARLSVCSRKQRSRRSLVSAS